MPEQAVTLSEPKYTFKLKSGFHFDLQKKLKITPGSLYKTDEDMVKLYGRGRWELVQDQGESVEDLRARIKALESKLPQAEAKEDSDDLERKSIKELREMAAGMTPPVDLTTVSGKTEIINTIRQAIDAA